MHSIMVLGSFRFDKNCVTDLLSAMMMTGFGFPQIICTKSSTAKYIARNSKVGIDVFICEG